MTAPVLPTTSLPTVPTPSSPTPEDWSGRSVSPEGDPGTRVGFRLDHSSSTRVPGREPGGQNRERVFSGPAPWKHMGSLFKMQIPGPPTPDLPKLCPGAELDDRCRQLKRIAEGGHRRSHTNRISVLRAPFRLEGAPCPAHAPRVAGGHFRCPALPQASCRHQDPRCTDEDTEALRG